MKKLLSVLLVVCLMMGICVTASAAVETYDLSDATKTSALTISSGKATCTSRFVGSDSTVKSVKITQTLEKFSFLWFWDVVGGEWNKTSNTSYSTFVNTKSGLTSGTYRVKSVFTVTMKTGQVETVTVYSAEKKIA